MDPVEGPWLHGFAATGVGGLRGEEPVRVGPLAKMNFLVGRNNHGKSSVLRAAGSWGGKQRSTSNAKNSLTLLSLPTRMLSAALNPNPRARRDLKEGAELADLGLEGRVGLWVPGVITNGFDGSHLYNLLRKWFPTGGLGHGSNESALAGPQKLVQIPAFRELRPTQGPDDASRRPRLETGEGLIRELGTWAHPANAGTPDYKAAKARWELLHVFMRDVLEDPTAELEVPHTQEDLHVRLSQAGEMLGIKDLGDGVKQVLMIAAACILNDDHLVSLEEPEIHLHAGLQRKLMRFLATKTNNQYLIATHSAHILDVPGARIFHVTHDGTSTTVSPAVRASDVQRICTDLGYMASDLLQANYTIWVEGPSDRVYWRRWLELVDPELAEGVHFTIMSYGGYLIDNVHLEDEPNVEKDLVQLLQLGRACTVIADSDKASESAELRPTVRRLREEADKPGSGHLLVPEWASTVENLLPRDLFRDTVIERHKRVGQRLSKASAHTPFTKPFQGMGDRSYSKVDIAQAVEPKLTLKHMDEPLRTEVAGLAARIREANGLPPTTPL